MKPLSRFLLLLDLDRGVRKGEEESESDSVVLRWTGVEDMSLFRPSVAVWAAASGWWSLGNPRVLKMVV